MAEEEHIPGQQPERGREQSSFPLTKEAVDRGLTEIAENPDRVVIEEGELMQIQNPELNSGLMSVLNTFPVERGKFTEGALYTYRLLRKQADMRGERIPIVSNDIWTTHIHDQIEAIRTVGREDPNAGMFESSRQQMETISEQDPEFGRAIKEITKYSPRKDHFFHGVVNTYLPVRKALEAQELERKFGDQ
jgi:hypothetical protein